MVRVARGLGLAVVSLSVLASAVVMEAATEPTSAESSGRVVRVAQKTKTVKKKVVRGKKSAVPGDEMEKPEPGEPKADTPKAAPAPAAGDDALKFSRDIAPILVANCAGCHIRPAKKRGDFDMTTFKKLMDGTKKEKVIEPGKPDESHLVLRIRGEETPKMPQGAMNNLAQVAIDKIEQWVKAGALLDAGKDPDAAIESYASSPEDLRLASLAKMSNEERDKHVETVDLDRWKKASPKTTPEVTVGKHFILLSTLPKTRAAGAIKKMDDQFESVRGLLGKDAVEWGEKASLFVFNDQASFGEFVQTNENRIVEASDTATARFSVPEPYVAVVDPMGGREGPEPLASMTLKKTARPKRGKAAAADDSAAEGPDRTLAGVLIEHFVSGAAVGKGKPPRWLTMGLGALVASHVEPASPYYRKLRRGALDMAELGWTTKANDALGDQETVDHVRAVGFAIMEWIYASNRQLVAPLTNAMTGGGAGLDNALDKVLGLSRQDFLARSLQFVMARYGGR